MSIWQSVHSIATIRLHVRKILTTRRLIILVLLLALVSVLLLYLSAPLNHLHAAQMQWTSQNIQDYRIVAKYEIPLYNCQQDLEVRQGEITYRHQDTCGGGTGRFQPLIVDNLFKRIEDSLTNPTCGPNGCPCDGPLGFDVIYNPDYGYPQQLIYQPMPNLRWRYIDYWQALLSGSLLCPSSTKNTLPFSGETISVQSLTPLKPAKSDSGIGTLPLGTPESP